MEVFSISLTRDQRLGGNKINIIKTNNNGYLKSYLALPISIPPFNIALASLALDLAEKCYRQQKPSKELIRNFVIGVEKLRSEQI
jgi:hypothetical protein